MLFVTEALTCGTGAIQNEDKWTALHEACCSGLAEVLSLLLARGADVHARCADGATPLHKAAHSGCRPIIKALLAAGADIAAEDKASNLHTHQCSGLWSIPLKTRTIRQSTCFSSAISQSAVTSKHIKAHDIIYICQEF